MRVFYHPDVQRAVSGLLVVGFGGLLWLRQQRQTPAR